MSESQFPSQQKIQENKQNIDIKNNINLSNYQNENIKINSQIKNQEDTAQEKESKIGYYILTPLESLILNKLMPHGFKFETEENFLKSLESSKIQAKKTKKTNNHNDNSYKLNNRPKSINYERNRGISQSKKRGNQVINNMDNIPINVSPEIYKITKKCQIGLERIKDTPWSNNFYQSNNPDVPCISKIEKKVNNYEYNSFYDFEMDLRQTWSYYFNIGQKGDQDIYEKTSKMSERWEKICSELENSNDEIYELSNVKKRAEKFQKEYNEYKDRISNKEIMPPPIKKVNNQNNDYKPMTLEEKNILGNLIRSLNKEQLRGIIRILAENNSITKSKYFEFDIDKLSTKKLRELEKYVNDCLSSNNNKSSNNNTQITNSNLNNNNNNKINQRENQINKNHNNDNNNKNNNLQNQNNNQEPKNDNKEINGTIENKQESIATKKIEQEKKFNNNSNSFSDPDSISSDSSLSN